MKNALFTGRGGQAVRCLQNLSLIHISTTFVESASGVTEGGRTGLTSMTTGILFLLAVVFSPLFLTIPSFATAPALIIVGFYMMGSAIKMCIRDRCR